MQNNIKLKNQQNYLSYALNGYGNSIGYYKRDISNLVLFWAMGLREINFNDVYSLYDIMFFSNERDKKKNSIDVYHSINGVIDGLYDNKNRVYYATLINKELIDDYLDKLGIFVLQNIKLVNKEISNVENGKIIKYHKTNMDQLLFRIISIIY